MSTTTKTCIVNGNPKAGTKSYKVKYSIPSWKSLCDKIGTEAAEALAWDNLLKHKLQAALRDAALGKGEAKTEEGQAKIDARNAALVARLEAGETFDLLAFAKKPGGSRRLVSKDVMAMLTKLASEPARLTAALGILGVAQADYDGQMAIDEAASEEAEEDSEDAGE